jgi:hypothetical protein
MQCFGITERHYFTSCLVAVVSRGDNPGNRSAVCSILRVLFTPPQAAGTPRCRQCVYFSAHGHDLHGYQPGVLAPGTGEIRSSNDAVARPVREFESDFLGAQGAVMT